MKKFYFALILSVVSISTAFSQIFVPDTIPVIVHVVHNGEAVGTGTNLHQAQIMSQFDVLNADYAGQGWNVGNVPPVWASLVSNTQITFVPALIDPNGNLLAEPGIERINRVSAGFTTPPYNNTTYIDATIKQSTQWNPLNYCNVWVLNLGGGLLGYSSFPPAANTTTDGVVIRYQQWGDTLNVGYPFDHGRTATHEFGHWLGGLTHPFGSCQTQTLADVPIGNYQSIMGCATYPAGVCSGFPDGAMFMNFMCSNNDSCMYMFTNLQGNAMKQGILTNHSTLPTSNVWHPVGIKNNLKASININIFPNPSRGKFTLARSSNSVNEIAEINVVDVLGKVVYQSEMKPGLINQEFDLSSKDKGIYFVKFISAKGIVTERIVIE